MPQLIQIINRTRRIRDARFLAVLPALQTQISASGNLGGQPAPGFSVPYFLDGAVCDGEPQRKLADRSAGSCEPTYFLHLFGGEFLVGAVVLLFVCHVFFECSPSQIFGSGIYS